MEGKGGQLGQKGGGKGQGKMPGHRARRCGNETCGGWALPPQTLNRLGACLWQCLCCAGACCAPAHSPDSERERQRRARVAQRPVDVVTGSGGRAGDDGDKATDTGGGGGGGGGGGDGGDALRRPLLASEGADAEDAEAGEAGKEALLSAPRQLQGAAMRVSTAWGEGGSGRERACGRAQVWKDTLLSAPRHLQEPRCV